jgi:hypothetical protein
MSIGIWIVTGLIAAAFLASGLMKLARPQQKLVAADTGWAGDFPVGSVTLIGAAEVLGAVGLILPAVTGIATYLVPVAASALAVIMIGAVVTHVRRGETRAASAPAVLAVLSIVVAVARFGLIGF